MISLNIYCHWNSEVIAEAYGGPGARVTRLSEQEAAVDNRHDSVS